MPWRVQALKGAMEAHMGGGWYGYQNMPRSLKFQEPGWKVDSKSTTGTNYKDGEGS
jgi:hypothetical protein